MKKTIYLICILIVMLLAITLANFVYAEDLATRLAGRILLQVEEHGQAWYVDPETKTRAFLGRPNDAFLVMKEFGLGVGEDDFIFFGIRAPKRLAGRIILRVESHGEAYYINPVDLRMHYLGKPQDAFQVMTDLGLGITDYNLAKIKINLNYQEYIYIEPETPEPIPVSKPQSDPELEPVPQPETDQPLAEESESQYLMHENITATVFWVGEPVGGGSSEDNALSAWDDEWQENYGGYDDPYCRNGYYPCAFTPLENPFYVSVPFNDFNDNGIRKFISYDVVPWADERDWTEQESMMKNKWVKVIHDNNTCYAQVEDTGPYQYNDYNYVFNNAKPINTLANSAGMDVSPALRDCLGFEGLNNDENKINWQFIDYQDVPDGPWTEIITTSQVNW
jgi:hypothetical protein